MPDALHSLLLTMFLVVFMTALGWLPIWLQDRKHKAVFWGMIAALIFGVSMLCRVSLPFWPAIAIGNSGLIIAHGLIWTACRSLRKRSPLPALFIVPAAIWLGLTFLPAFRADVNFRILVFAALATYLDILAIREVRLFKRGNAVIRNWVLGVIGVQVTITLLWAAWTAMQPVAHGQAFSSIPGIIPTLFGVTGFILLLGPAIVALDKELSDLRYRDIARNDFMTGVGNRRHFEEALTRHFNRAAKQSTPLSLIMIDADQFKDYNDLYGHPAGDRCLQALADVLRHCCRPNDVVGRYGGEEFAVLLPGTGAETAHAIAKRMLNKVRELRLEHSARPGGFVTISIGVTSTEPNRGMMPSDLIETADRALYQAKHNGRDRICSIDDDSQAEMPLSTAAE